MEVNQIICNVCRRTKGETNHWFKAVVNPEMPGLGIAFGTSVATVDDPSLVIEHICGEACMHKRLSQWIATPINHSTPQESVTA